jgi:hypothetical protein
MHDEMPKIFYPEEKWKNPRRGMDFAVLRNVSYGSESG